MKISSRLYLGFGLLITLAGISGIVNLLGLNSTSNLVNKMHTHPLTVSNYARDIKVNILAIHRQICDALLSEDPEEIIKLDNKISHTENETFLIFDEVKAKYLGPPIDVNNARLAFSDWKETIIKIMENLKGGNRKKATAIAENEESEHVDNALSKLKTITDYARNKADTFLSSASDMEATAYRWSSIIFFITILTGLLITLFFSRSINNSIKDVSDMANDIADGRDVSLPDADRSDEISQIVTSLARMDHSNREIIKQAKAISEGNYSYSLSPRSDYDVLGKALIVMNDTLRESREKQILQNWLNEGQKKLNLLLRGEPSISELCDRILSFMAAFLESQVGTFYIVQDDDRLHLAAAYGLLKIKEIPEIFDAGEGLIGQAVLKKDLINITDTPEGYFKIKSGTGEKRPSCLLIMPFVWVNRVNSVLEMGSFKPFSDNEVSFLRTVQESIAVKINSIYSRMKVDELLERTKNQAEELLAQREDLTKANLILETQAEALKESEKKLQEQQEELRQTNEELGEQTRVLEGQKENLNRKNRDLEEARRLLEEKARDIEDASRYKSEFLANMSHELRTPLNSIILLSQLLGENKDNNLTEKQVEYAGSVQTSGYELLNLINEILDLSKVEAGKMELVIEDVSISEIVSNLRMHFQNKADEKGIALIIDTAGDAPGSIKTDRQRVEQILKNLLSNAFKFTARGSVTLKIESCTEDNSESNGTDSVKPGISFSVSDTGIGIPEDKLKIIFEAFQQADGTTSRKFGGTGLGLTISRDFASLLGGKIKAESNKDKGSVFTLCLPAVYKNEKSLKGSEQKAGSYKNDNHEKTGYLPDDRKDIDKNDRTILIVEDDQEFAKILRDISREKGFKTLVVEDGETALHFADYYRPTAIILDVKLPGVSGWTVISRLKENMETRHIPVHFISGSERNHSALRMGAVDFITKPLNMDALEQLFSNIENVISKSIKDLLIIEDNPLQKKLIKRLLEDSPVNIVDASTGQEALQKLSEEDFDCIILDLGLPDMSGFELLSKIKGRDPEIKTPIVVYTGKELTSAEKAILDEYTESIILKGANSPGRLLDEVVLFLHLVEESLPEEKRRLIQLVHDKEHILNNKKILLADDDMRNVFALTSILEEKAMQVFSAANGKEALGVLDSGQQIDLVLMDIMMPEMDGYEAMEEIRKREAFKNLPIIALTAKAMKGDRIKCIKAGASDYLAKPVDRDKLFSMLRVWLYN